MERRPSTLATGALALLGALQSGAEAAESRKVLKAIELDARVTHVLDRTVIDVGVWNPTDVAFAELTFGCKGYDGKWPMWHVAGEVSNLPAWGSVVARVYFHGLADSVICRATGALRE